MEKIKLVIWDLDETFWKGTLSEEGVTPIEENIKLLEKLTNHGIINSISSKNDFDKAKEKLEALGVWGYFVFPSINWNPKGESVRQIIADCQLRSPNVVFIDDNASNRNEVAFYNQDIKVMESPEQLIENIKWEDYKEDTTHKRLQQYKLLEEKKDYRNECSSNLDFLIKSNIRIKFINNLQPIKERLVEMIGRTNQLNFTKKRIGISELEALIDDSRIECAAIQVIDNFGDYGICGFYALDKTDKTLLHFLFSCRILNLGVENYVYQKLGSPRLTIVEPVSSKLDATEVSWIKEIKDEDIVSTPASQTNNKKPRVCLLGGCDLDQMCHYLEGQLDIVKDFNYPNKLQNAVHREHTIFLRKADGINDTEREEIFNLPFLDGKILDYHFLTNDYDYLVFSPLMNYTQDIYEHVKYGFKIAYGGYVNILIANEVNGLTKEQLNSFKENYKYVGQQSPDDFKKDLEWLLGKVKKPIIFINGATVEVDNPKEIGSTERQMLMNLALGEFVAQHADRCQILDVNEWVKSSKDLRDNIRHYQRPVYINMAERLLSIVSNNHVSIDRFVIFKVGLQRIINKFKSFIKRSS